MTLPNVQLWRVYQTVTAWLGAGTCAADGCSGSGQVVRLDDGATLGLVSLGPPSVAYVVLTNPSANTRASARPLAQPGIVVFGNGIDANPSGSEDVRLKLPVLVTDAGGLYLYDELGDPRCPLAQDTRLAVLTTDSRMGMLVQTVNNDGMAVANMGWLPVRHAGNRFLVLRPPVTLPPGQGC